MQLELLQPHTHAGVAHAPGAVIELDDDLARWLIDLAAAHPLRATPVQDTLPTLEKSP